MRLLLALCALCASLQTIPVRAQTPAPATNPEILRAIEQTQRKEDDQLVEAVETNLRQLRRLLRGPEYSAMAGGQADAGGATQLRDALAARQSEMDALRAEFMQRLTAQEQMWHSRGDTSRAAEVQTFKARLEERFAQLARDLKVTASGSGRVARPDAALARIDGWLATRPVDAVPLPNFKAATPPAADTPAPAGSPPKFVLDAVRDTQRFLAARGGFATVALRPTPAGAASCGYSAPDLSDQPEAPRSQPDVQALAAELDYDPMKMFEWVVNNVEFEPYYGSMKGGLGALWSKAGGATDQASLLIALLRAANIPARYVRGNIAVVDSTPLGSEGRAPRWIGAKTYAGAREVLRMNGNPSTAFVLSPSQQQIGVLFAHVWVEACLPYANYRGTAGDDSGHRWVPLDPSYKENRYQAGIALDDSLDFDYASWLSSRLDTQGRYLLPHERFEDQAEANAKTKAPNYQNNVLEDIPYKSVLDKLPYDILPIVPPYEVAQYTSWSGVAGDSSETAVLPDRHKVRLQVSVRLASGTSDPLAGTLLARKTFALSDIALKRLTLSFKGADAPSQAAFDAWFNSVDPELAPTCSASASMVPVLRAEGTEQAPEAGGGSTPLCSTNNVLQLVVTQGEQAGSGILNQTHVTNIRAASIHALHAFAQHVSDHLIAVRSELLLDRIHANPGNPNADPDGIEGEFLNIAAARYSRHVADGTKRIARLFGESGTTGISLGLTGAQVKVNYVFDLPYGLFRQGFFVDWPSNLYTGTNLATPGTIDNRTLKLSGFMASAYEAFIWQQIADLDAISTTRGLQYAHEQGYEILTLNASNWAAESCKLTNTCANPALNTNTAGMSYAPQEVSGIQANFIANGFTLTIPRRLVEYSGWKGSTYYGENLALRALAFPISASSGGMTVRPGGQGTGGDDISGGYGQGQPVAPPYNPGLGTGYVPESTAPSTAQNAGQNSATTANGVLPTATTLSGDPVNMITGNWVHTERDVSIKGRGGFPIIFERSYNSLQPKDGPLGFGWTHSFNHFLRFYGLDGGAAAKVGWNDGTGGERFFSTTSHQDGNIAAGAAFTVPPGIYATVTRLADGRYQVTERSGVRYLFESVTAGATDTGLRARLLSIVDRNGNALTLAYSATCGNRLCSVTDALNRSLTFTYTGSRIDTVADWTGRQWKYEYDGNGDLVRFRNPLALSGSLPPVDYQYYGAASGPRLAHAMKQYKLPRGNGMRIEYYANGKVFRHVPFGTDGTAKEDHATTFTWTQFRRESHQVDAEGHARTFIFDPNGNVIKLIDEAGAQREYTYETAAGRTHLRATEVDPQGMSTAYTYDGSGNVTDVLLPSGRTIQYRDYTAFGRPQRIKDPVGNWTLLRFDANGNLSDEVRTRAGVTPAAGATPAATDVVAWTKYQVDSAGNVTAVKRLREFAGATLGTFASGAGPSLESAYDANRLNVTSLTRRGDKDGTPASPETDTYTDFAYDALGRLKRGPDAAWYASEADHDALDRQTRTTDARGQKWNTVFDENGNPAFTGLTIGAAFVDGSYGTWDDLDRPERRVDYAGNATRWSYNRLGHLTTAYDPDGFSVGFDRDPLGRVLATYDQAGHRASTSRDADGKPRATTDPNGLTTEFDYYHAEADGRLRRTTLPAVGGTGQGRAAELAYDGVGRVIMETQVGSDGATRQRYFRYDELGRVVRSVGFADGAGMRLQTCNVYTPLGDLKETWAGPTTETAGVTCNFGDPNLKRQVAATYDDFGRRLTAVDALNRTWRWSWNVHDELASSQTPVQAAAGQSTTYTWERGGLLRTRTVPGTAAAGQAVSTTYNALGQAVRSETRDGSGGLLVAYDYTYDAAHRLATVTDSRGGKRLAYTWSPGGRLSGLNDSDGHQLRFNYDAVGRLASIVAPNGEQVSFTFDAGGRLTERRLANGQITTQAWHEDDSLANVTHRFGGTLLTSHAYTLDAFGRRATHAELIGGAAKAWTYGYDGQDRLTSANDGTSTESYAYDVFGNRRSRTTPAGTTAYLYDAAHQLAEIRSGSDAGALIGAAVHDASGRLVKLCEGPTVSAGGADCGASGTGSTVLALAYNALDQLLSATRTQAGAVAESYAYDDSGRRVRKTSGGTTTHYLYNGAAIHAEWNGAPSGAPSAFYLHGAGTDTPILRLTGATGGPSAGESVYLQDGLGSVVGVVSAAGSVTGSQRFDAWGVRTAAGGFVPTYGYTGREPDATGLVFYRARSYHPGLARFTARDPMGAVDAPSLYAYAANNPVNLVDPFGLAALDPATAQQVLTELTYFRQTASDAPPACSIGDLCAQLVLPVNPATGVSGTVGAGGTRPGDQSLNSGNKGSDFPLEGGGDRSGGSGGSLDPCELFPSLCQSAGSPSTKPWTRTSGASAELGKALENAGMTRYSGTAAHHIVGFDTRFAPAQEVLTKFGIQPNQAANGVFLPARSTSAATGAWHPSLNNSEYIAGVNSRVVGAQSRAEAISILRNIRLDLQSGVFPGSKPFP